MHEGQPYCKQHYHQANNSICADGTCREPIEGPCAEDYEGRRYHPDHLVCSVPRCRVRLKEYYTDTRGRMYCERHAQHAAAPLRGVDDQKSVETALKRQTRFLDLR